MFNYIIYRIGQFIAQVFPLKAAYKLAVFFSDVHYLFANIDRRTVGENYKAIFPEKSGRDIRRLRLQMFRNFAKYLVDFFRFPQINREYIKKNIKLVNLHYLDEALSKGNGVIALTAHIGNWELGAAVMGMLGYPCWAVALPHKHKAVDKFFNAQRESKGVHVIPLGISIRQCIKVLRENKVVGLVGDRNFNGGGVVLDFFGRPSYLPEGAAALALKTKALIVPGFMLRNHDDSFTFRFEKPIEVVSSGSKEKDLVGALNRCKEIYEEYIRRYPDQWYMFRRFWIK